MTRIINTLADIADRYDCMFLDLWGCVHNGIAPFAEAVDAMHAFKAKGGTVLLLTNAPRSRHSVATQLDGMDLPRDSWDVIATSGDSARAAMFRGVVGAKVYFIGQPHDTSFFDPLNLIDNPATITQVPLDQADGIVCCGPFDPSADPDTYRPDFLYAKTKGLKLLCANPDIVVDRGDTREWCAGALAQLYTDMGGESLYFGKPHPPIYDLARRRLRALGLDIPDDRILCVGDGIVTDVPGAIGENLDSLYITGGLARAETKTDIQPDPAALKAHLNAANMTPTYAIGALR
ncbi:MAG: TIGR01459 family HAD-type hydrolase [Pseudomonadota bacterium]